MRKYLLLTIKAQNMPIDLFYHLQNSYIRCDSQKQLNKIAELLQENGFLKLGSVTNKFDTEPVIKVTLFFYQCVFEDNISKDEYTNAGTQMMNILEANDIIKEYCE